MTEALKVLQRTSEVFEQNPGLKMRTAPAFPFLHSFFAMSVTPPSPTTPPTKSQSPIPVALLRLGRMPA